MKFSKALIDEQDANYVTEFAGLSLVLRLHPSSQTNESRCAPVILDDRKLLQIMPRTQIVLRLRKSLIC